MVVSSPSLTSEPDNEYAEAVTDKVETVESTAPAKPAVTGYEALSQLFTGSEGVDPIDVPEPVCLQRREMFKGLLSALESRFNAQKDKFRLEGIEWAEVEKKLVGDQSKLQALLAMEAYAGEPGLYRMTNVNGDKIYVFGELAEALPPIEAQPQPFEMPNQGLYQHELDLPEALRPIFNAHTHQRGASLKDFRVLRRNLTGGQVLEIIEKRIGGGAKLMSPKDYIYIVGCGFKLEQTKDSERVYLSTPTDQEDVLKEFRPGEESKQRFSVPDGVQVICNTALDASQAPKIIVARSVAYNGGVVVVMRAKDPKEANPHDLFRVTIEV